MHTPQTVQEVTLYLTPTCKLRTFRLKQLTASSNFKMESRKRQFKFATLMLAVVVASDICTMVKCQTTSSPPPPPPCSTHPTCDSCVQNPKCLWCMTNGTCTDYPVSYVVPPPSVCKLSQARWGLCWVNFEALIIAMAVVSGTIIISIGVCCCCCCCCKKSHSRLDRDEERFSRRREEIRQRSEDRKVERRVKHDEIRKKYGLIPDSDHPYSKFENE